MIIPRAEVSVDSVSNPSAATQGLISSGLFPSKADGIAGTALIPATYGNYQLSQDLFIGLGINSGFGLSTEPNNVNYKGAIPRSDHAADDVQLQPDDRLRDRQRHYCRRRRSDRILPRHLALRHRHSIAPVAGVDFPAGQTTSFEGDGFGYGATAGVMLEPLPGRRSAWAIARRWISTSTAVLPNTTALNTGAEADLRAARHRHGQYPPGHRSECSPSRHVRVDALEPLPGSDGQRDRGRRDCSRRQGGRRSIASLPQNWHDGWFLSVGGEYDLSQTVTLRTRLCLRTVADPERSGAQHRHSGR